MSNQYSTFQVNWKQDAAEEIMRRVNKKAKFEQFKCTLEKGIQHDCRQEGWQNLLNNFVTPLGFLGLVALILTTVFNSIKKTH